MDESRVAPHTLDPMYVRALVLCGAVERRPDGMEDLRAVLSEIQVPRDAPGLRFEFEAFIAIERNRDNAPHSMRVVVIDPTEREVNWTDPVHIPSTEGGTIRLSTPVLLQTIRPLDGRWRVLVEIDGIVKAHAPLDMYLVDPAEMGLPKRASH